ncbi:hypothetical protein GCM10025787_22230 [Saccharopolyspora rosea]
MHVDPPCGPEGLRANGRARVGRQEQWGQCAGPARGRVVHVGGARRSGRTNRGRGGRKRLTVICPLHNLAAIRLGVAGVDGFTGVSKFRSAFPPAFARFGVIARSATPPGRIPDSFECKEDVCVFPVSWGWRLLPPRW